MLHSLQNFRQKQYANVECLFQVVSYLVYEGVVMQEELEQAVRSGEDNLLPHVRRLHLVVTALREFFVALDVCLKKEQNLCNAGNLLQIKGLITFLKLEIISGCS